jgi:hypothetical protein
MFAMMAAPYEQEEGQTINQKRRGKTQKNSNINVQPPYSNNVKGKDESTRVKLDASVIHTNHDDDDDNDSDSANIYTSYPKSTESATSTSTVTEPMINMTSFNPPTVGPSHSYSSASASASSSAGPGPSNQHDTRMELHNYASQYGTEQSNRDYYARMLPGGGGGGGGGFKNSTASGQSFNSEDELMKKMNYLITLMEDQQDEKTGTVVEDVVLYSFLGIFVICIVDSFARVGKYSR